MERDAYHLCMIGVQTVYQDPIRSGMKSIIMDEEFKDASHDDYDDTCRNLLAYQ